MKLTLNAQEFEQAIKQVLPMVSKSQERPQITGVLVKLKPGAKVKITAADGFIMGTSTLRAESTKGPNTEFGAILPAKWLSGVIKGITPQSHKITLDFDSEGVTAAITTKPEGVIKGRFPCDGNLDELAPNADDSIGQVVLSPEQAKSLDSEFKKVKVSVLRNQKLLFYFEGEALHLLPIGDNDKVTGIAYQVAGVKLETPEPWIYAIKTKDLANLVKNCPGDEAVIITCYPECRPMQAKCGNFACMFMPIHKPKAAKDFSFDEAKFEVIKI